MKGFVCDSQYLKVNPVSEHQRSNEWFVLFLAPDNSCSILLELEVQVKQEVVFKYLGLGFQLNLHIMLFLQCLLGCELNMLCCI